MTSSPATRLPNAARAIVEQHRLRQYLLNPAHPVGGSKAAFFIAHGFTADVLPVL
jgi:hypothetical protein